jgi:hypothetical protein
MESAGLSGRLLILSLNKQPRTVLRPLLKKPWPENPDAIT